MLARLAHEREAQEAVVEMIGLEVVGAEQRHRLDFPAALLERFAFHRFDERLAIFPVPRGLIELELAVDALLDHEEAAVALDDRGGDDVGVAAHVSLPLRST